MIAPMKNHKGLRCAGSIGVGLVALLGFLGGTDRPNTLSPRTDERRILTFRADAVDGVDVLVLRDGLVRIEHREYRPMKGVRFEVIDGDFGDDVIVVRNKRGRPAVRVLEQPSDANGRRLKVLIDDGPASGDAPLEFELVAVPKGESTPDVKERAPNPKNVVIITIDSLRPDRLSCYGYERETSPNLDRLAASSLRFEQAYSPSSFTPPSHASLLTSRWVGDHGLLTWNPLDDQQVSIAEILSSRGYRCGASVNLGLLGAQNLGQGFEWQREGHRDGKQIVRDGLEFIADSDSRPFFLWLHLYDVHRPYGRAKHWRDRFGIHDSPEIGDPEDHYNLKPQSRDELGLSDADLAYICDRYDAGIAYTDAHLGPLLAELSTPTRLADTLLIVTADHGESLLDHAERSFTHDPFLYSAVTRVPLIVRLPGAVASETTRSDLASLIDIAPTILDLIGLPPAPTFSGRSLLPSAKDQTKDRPGVFHECWGWEELKAFRTRDWLAVWDMETQTSQYFDLRHDPREQTPLDEGPEALESVLENFATRAHAIDGPVPLSEELIEQLKELGYIDR